MKNIIFLIDAQKGASGGGKVIYQYSNYIDSLENYSSSIIHIKKKKIKKIFNSINKKFNGRLNNTEYSGWKFKDMAVKKDYYFPCFNIRVRNKRGGMAELAAPSSSAAPPPPGHGVGDTFFPKKGISIGVLFLYST